MSALAEVGNTHFESLDAFDASVSSILKNLNTPLDTSLALGYKKNQNLYLKTIGSGEIYIGRGKIFERIIQGNENAAGKYEENDFYLFTTSFFTQSLKGTSHTRTLLHNKTTIRDFPERIKQTLGAEDDTGAVALFVRMSEYHGTYVSGTNTFKWAWLKPSLDLKKKIVIGVILCICLGLFGWSITKGIQNKGGLQLGQGQSYDEKKLKIEDFISQAETKKDISSEALPLLYEAADSLSLLSKSSPKDKQQELSEIQKKINTLEATITKRTEATPQEYYDFALEEKGAKGTRLALFEDKLSVLNPEGKIYILTLEKKSLIKATLPKKVSGESLIAGYETNSYILDPLVGITKIDESGKAKVVIPKETQWMSINEMNIYNGNIYLLDGGNNALYKYPVTTDGYGDRTSYFKGSYMDMDAHSSFAINISVYVSTQDTITKYTAGLKDDFKISLPGKTVDIQKVITHIDQKEIYVWDKKNKTLYRATVDGEYKGQIVSSLIGTASDIEVYNNKVYLLKDAKLYWISL